MLQASKDQHTQTTSSEASGKPLVPKSTTIASTKMQTSTTVGPCHLVVSRSVATCDCPLSTLPASYSLHSTHT